MRERKPKRRTQGFPWQMWAVFAAGGLLIMLALAAFVSRPRAAAQLTGGAIANPPAPAAEIALTDQFGQPEQLSDWRGRPVALTFIYTNCPDVCPLISANMHRAYQLLGSQAGQVQLAAVTVDPERDNVAQIHGFSDKLGLTDEWFFLTGTRPQLEKVWAAYGILAQKENVTPGAVAAANSPDAIEHSAPVFLIDKKGMVRAMLPVDVTGETLATDLKVLLAEQ